MVRSIISIVISLALVIGGAIYENIFIKTTFDELNVMAEELQIKIQEETAVTDDILAIQKFWISKKDRLHSHISHTEIKEVDLWISECVTYTKHRKFEDAEAKLEVVKELFEQIPKQYLLKFENIF